MGIVPDPVCNTGKMLETHFGAHQGWPHQDLIGYTEQFQPAMALAAYRCGVFPMPLEVEGFEEAMGWWSPLRRAGLAPEELRVTRSMRKSARRYTTTVDVHFAGVLAACADPDRDGRWIDERIETVYAALHHSGYVHSVETWDAEGRLVGGLYAIHQHGLVAGESMFHHPELGRDASKVALMRLVVEMRRIGARLLDVQWLTPHLESLGAREVPRREYLRMLSRALDVPHNNAWNSGASLSGEELLEQLDERSDHA